MQASSDEIRASTQINRQRNGEGILNPDYKLVMRTVGHQMLEWK